MKTRKELLDEIHNFDILQQKQKEADKKDKEEKIKFCVSEYEDALAKVLIPSNPHRSTELTASTEVERIALNQISNKMWNLGYNVYSSSLSTSKDGKTKHSVVVTVTW